MLFRSDHGRGLDKAQGRKQLAEKKACFILSHQHDDFMSAWIRFTASRPSCKRLELPQQRPQQLNDRRVNLHGSAYGPIGLPSATITLRRVCMTSSPFSPRMRPQQAFVFGIDQHLHKALGYTSLARMAVGCDAEVSAPFIPAKGNTVCCLSNPWAVI